MASPTRDNQLEVFRDTFNPDINSGYYPFCGSDTAPWDTFSDATIIGIDIDSYSVGKLQEQGITTAVVADAGEYDFDRSVDALFLFGWLWSEGKLSTLTNTVKPGGYVVTDSFVNAADIAGRQKNDFKISGRIGKDGQADTAPVDGGEITGLGILQYLQERHRSPIPIGTICLELELTMPEIFRSNLIVLRRN